MCSSIDYSTNLYDSNNFRFQIQEIASKNNFEKLSKFDQIKASEGSHYELFCKPGANIACLEKFYNELSKSERIALSYTQLKWLQDNHIGFRGLSQNVTKVNFNIEPDSIRSLTNVIVETHVLLRSQGIELILEITERNRSIDYKLVKLLELIGEHEIKIALDDLSVKEVQEFNFAAIDFVDYIKIKLSDICTLDSKDLSLQKISSNSIIIVENIESEQDIRKLEGFPVDLFQGYHIGRPKPISFDNVQ